MGVRFIGKSLFKHGLWLRRLEIGDNPTGTPVLAPLFLLPTAAPTFATPVKGEFYFDSTRNVLMAHNGTSFLPSGGLSTVKTAAATLSAGDSGARCFFNSAAGDLYTLPAPQIGLRFRFEVLVTITSNSAKVLTDAGTTFLLGTFVQSTDGTYTSALQAANGTNIRSWNGNGTTTGGIKGDWFELTCITATQWAITGMGSATGSEATPFATS